MTRMTGPYCTVMCNLVNTHKHTHPPRGGKPQSHSRGQPTAVVAVVASRVATGHPEVGRDRPVAPFPFHGARTYVSPVWPWWDFLGWGRRHDRAPPARDNSGPEITVEREGRARGGTPSDAKVWFGDSTALQLSPLHGELGYKSRAFSCLALTYDLCQAIPAPGIVALGKAVANSSQCAVLQQSPCFGTRGFENLLDNRCVHLWIQQP